MSHPILVTNQYGQALPWAPAHLQSFHFLIFIGVYLIYKFVLVSAVQQSESDVHILVLTSIAFLDSYPS